MFLEPMAAAKNSGEPIFFIEIKTLKIFIFYFYFSFYFILALPSLWDLSSLTRDQTRALGSESTES